MEASRKYEFKPIDQLVFSDDFMFGAVMREPDICKGVRFRGQKWKSAGIVFAALSRKIIAAKGRNEYTRSKKHGGSPSFIYGSLS